MVDNTIGSESRSEETAAKPNESRRQFLQVIGGASAGVAGMASPAGAERSQKQNNNLVFVEEGEPNGVILWWSSDTESVASFAASELQSYIAEMTGAVIPVEGVELTNPSKLETAVSGLTVLTGGAANRFQRSNGSKDAQLPVGWAKSADRALTGAKPDSFAIQTDGNRMVFAGSTHRGTLYAAYEFLERQGVRFFAPDFSFYDENAEHVPSTSTLKPSALDLLEEPSMEYRRKYVEEGWSHTDLNLPQLIDWMAKNRHNVLVYPTDYRNFDFVRWDMWREELIPELEKRGMKLETGGHGFDSFLRPEKYEDDNPEWFVDGYNVFNIANDEAVQTYVDEVIAHLEDRPEIDIFDAWPPDGADWPPSVIEEFGSIANAYAHVVNQLDEALDDRLSRDIELEAIAYASHKQPPDPDYMYQDSVIIDFAPWDRSYRVPIYSDENEVNESYVELIEDWKEGFDGSMAFYEYYRKYLWHSLPVSLPELISQEIPFFESVGLNGIGIYSEPADWIPYELNHLLVAQLSWNTELDTNAYLQDYLETRFDGAADEMWTYFELTEQAGRRIWDGTRDNLFVNNGDLDVISSSREDYLETRDTLSTAMDKATSSSTSDLIQRLAWNIDFAIADMEISYYGTQGDQEKEDEARQTAETLVESHRFDGILLQSKWIMNRYSYENYLPSNEWMRDMYRVEFGSKEEYNPDPGNGDDDENSGDDGEPETVHYDTVEQTITPDGDLETDGLSAWTVADDGTIDVQTDGDAGGTIGGDIWLSWDTDNLYFQAAIDDQTHNQPYEIGGLYRGDAIQVAVAPGGEGWSGFQQYTLALTQDGPLVYGQIKPSNEAQGVRDFNTAMVRDDAAEVTRYEVAIPWSELDDLGGFDPTNDDWLGVDWAILDNDNDEQNGLENFVRWDVTGDSAITGGKQPEHLKTAQLLD